MFYLINPNSTFIQVHLPSGTITILPRQKAGPFDDSELTQGIAADISRGIAHIERVSEQPADVSNIEDAQSIDKPKANKSKDRRNK